MKFSKIMVFGAAATISLASAAQAQVTATDENTILQAMQDFGLVATMGTDNSGDPKISSRVSSTKFKVYFYGCTDNTQCTSIQFGAGYDLKSGISALKVNEWNTKKRFAKAYIDDEGDPFLEMDINTDFDGIGIKNFEDSMDLWRSLVEDFEDFIDW